ncbi:hypothetical protein IAQ61_005516 [Plenodomus lingam]|uniref:uncharacterized protein n=1 Tax=Leptosphaeria maculans TaxID=5022 RepID=UPI00331BD1EC|nr:hypothetical protein IAQ61_005516 [Plenodomus lingam]
MAPNLLESATQPTTTASNIFPTAIPSSKQPANTTTTEISPSTITPTTSPPNTNTLVLDPSLITNDIDRLRFEAAAYTQLPKPFSPNHPSPNSSPPPSSTDLISSPYNNPGHYLSLPTLPLPSILLAKALTALHPTVPHYATAHYTSALNFPHVLAVLRDLLHSEQQARGSWQRTSFYVVVFRSKLKTGVDVEWLYKLDYESHAEACASGGLLKYWFGKADGEGRNLATCMCFFPFRCLFLLHTTRAVFPITHAHSVNSTSRLSKGFLFSEMLN